MWTPTWPLALATLLLALGGDRRARLEERSLVVAFGDRYRDYARRVPRFIPGVY